MWADVHDFFWFYIIVTLKFFNKHVSKTNKEGILEMSNVLKVFQHGSLILKFPNNCIIYCFVKGWWSFIHTLGVHPLKYPSFYLVMLTIWTNFIINGVIEMYQIWLFIIYIRSIFLIRSRVYKCISQVPYSLNSNQK